MPRRIRPPQRYAEGQGIAPRKPKPQTQSKVTKPEQQQRVAKETASRSRSVSRASGDSSDESLDIIGDSDLQRRRREVKALWEIYNLQTTTQLLIPKMSFSRVIREVLMEYMGNGYRITLECLTAIQEAAEMYMVQVFEDSNKCCIHRDRVTVDVKDMRLALFLRERWCK